MSDISIGEWKERRKNAWKNFKNNRSYVKPLYFDRHSAPIGESTPKLLNTAGQMLFRMFIEMDLALNRALLERERNNGSSSI